MSLLLLSSLIFIGFSSFISNPVPDTEIFGKEFIETIKKKSKDAYINKYSITKEDFTWISTQIDVNAYVSEEMKKSYQEYMLKDTSFTKKMYAQLSENYNAIELWMKEDTIDVSQISYIRTFYTMSYFNNMPFNVLSDGLIFIKHKNSYYKFEIAQVAFINNKWLYGERLKITKVDKYLNCISSGYTSEAITGTDTVAVAPGMDADRYDETEAYTIAEDGLVIEKNTNRYSGLHPKQAKKIEKMQKQIDALYIKMDKEYSKEY
jgi:hypothetical protein